MLYECTLQYNNPAVIDIIMILDFTCRVQKICFAFEWGNFFQTPCSKGIKVEAGKVNGRQAERERERERDMTGVISI